MFAFLQSLAALLSALLAVCAVARALRLDFPPAPARDLWKRLGGVGRVLASFAVALLALYAVSKEPSLRSSPPRLLPEWFTALGYDPAETDGDGIPDCWERWTRTSRSAADDGLDPDGDGVDNFGEFWNQCDPMMADTDGDGYSDYVEIAGKAAGKAWYDPIAPASYDYTETDANTNGVPDRWEGTGYVYGFTDANHDGLPDGLTFPTAGDGNFDIEVTVATSRSALLSWGAATGEALVLPPCNGQVVRLRLLGNADTDVRLSCGTLGDGSDGLWKARMSIEWAPRQNQETEGDRIRLVDGTVVECEAMEASFRGEVETAPRRSPQNDVPTSVSSPFRRRRLDVAGISFGCWEHDPGGAVRATATYANISTPFSWYVNGTLVPTATGDTLSAGEIRDHWSGEAPLVVKCEWTGGLPHLNIRVEGEDTIDFGHCRPGVTNVVGATSTSSHDPADASDHLPCAAPEPIVQPNPNCPPATNLTIKAGWTHDTAILWIRNLVRIIIHDPQDDETDHCIGLVWSKGGSISLYDYLADCCKPYANKFTYYVNGNPCEGALEFGDEPNKYHPTVFHVELRDENGGETLDRMWVVVNANIEKIDFDTWFVKNASTSWVNALPKPYAKLQISTNWLGRVNATPENPANPDSWEGTRSLSGYLHHDSKWEMRSKKIGDHGNQACYDGNGNIVLEGIAGGTADFFYAGGRTVPDHVREDVNPFLSALHLDGNPGDTGWFNGISRPCLYQGDHLDKYIERRPIIHPEGEQE